MRKQCHSDPWGYFPVDRDPLQRCFECGETTTGRHHVVPVSQGGTKQLPLCPTCHNIVHACETIQPALIKAGLERLRAKGIRLGPPLRWTGAVPQHAARLREQGKSYKRIADILGFSVGTVHKYLSAIKE